MDNEPIAGDEIERAARQVWERWQDAGGGAPSREHFSTGQVARVCGVSPRTVAKWCDSGFLKAQRAPPIGGHPTHRRVTRGDLAAFLQLHQIPSCDPALFPG